MPEKQLIIQGDDFGMCHAINVGIAQAFRAGTLTQASVMAPCPWVSEAFAIANELDMPVGVHGTLTCEWDHLRWRPLTDGESLVESDGTMHRALDGAIAEIDAQEASRELRAQVEALRKAGLTPSYLDCHMGPTTTDGFSAACQLTGLPFLYPVIENALAFSSIAMMSNRPAEEKKSWLLDRLENLEPGVHLVVTHPAVASPELANIARPESENFCWAETNRTSDLDVLLDPDVAKRIEELDIDLVAVRDLA